MAAATPYEQRRGLKAASTGGLLSLDQRFSLIGEEHMENVRQGERKAQAGRNWPTRQTVSDFLIESGMLVPRDLAAPSLGVEDELLGMEDLRNLEQAYPYCRRYALETGAENADAIFGTLGLARRGLVFVTPSGRDEFALHWKVLNALSTADMQLRFRMEEAATTPITPSVAPRLDINTWIYNASDRLLDAAPMFMPAAPSAACASRHTWLPVQRGMLQVWEELARAAVLNHSSTLHALDQLELLMPVGALPTNIVRELRAMLQRQLATLVEMLHQSVYAHRQAYVRHCPRWLRHEILGQRIYGQRRLFEIPDVVYERLMNQDKHRM